MEVWKRISWVDFFAKMRVLFPFKICDFLMVAFMLSLIKFHFHQNNAIGKLARKFVNIQDYLPTSIYG